MVWNTQMNFLANPILDVAELDTENGSDATWGPAVLCPLHTTQGSTLCLVEPWAAHTAA